MKPATVGNGEERLRPQPWLEEWPSHGLEAVPFCPACGSDQRVPYYCDLTDKVFYTAPGRWTLIRCQKCGSAYLDPRPKHEFIYLAYGTYYTHQASEPEIPLKSLPVLLQLRRALANGYLNWRFGTSLKPAIRLGVTAAWLMPPLRRQLDQKYRYLPRPVPGSRLLDVGFGNAEFLENAMAAGWVVAGVDPDGKAVANAEARGLNVQQGGIEAVVEEDNSFDAITLSHVIEHVPDPVAVIGRVFRLLRPGGVLYIETPNIESCGHQQFGQNWLHLDPPRHLVIFTRDSMRQLLEAAGFERISFLPRTNEYAHMFDASNRIAKMQDPFVTGSEPTNWKMKLASLRGHFERSKQEYLTIVAVTRKKP